MQVYNIDSAVHGEAYQIFIPKEIATTIKVYKYNGYGEEYQTFLEEGFYAVKCIHHKYTVSQPKSFQLCDGAFNNDPSISDKSIKGVKLQDLRNILGV
jgi:hypothetical protein